MKRSLAARLNFVRTGDIGLVSKPRGGIGIGKPSGYAFTFCSAWTIQLMLSLTGAISSTLDNSFHNPE